jgi:hypothetical protein
MAKFIIKEILMPNGEWKEVKSVSLPCEEVHMQGGKGNINILDSIYRVIGKGVYILCQKK